MNMFLEGLVNAENSQVYRQVRHNPLRKISVVTIGTSSSLKMEKDRYSCLLRSGNTATSSSSTLVAGSGGSNIKWRNREEKRQFFKCYERVKSDLETLDFMLSYLITTTAMNLGDVLLMVSLRSVHQLHLQETSCSSKVYRTRNSLNCPLQSGAVEPQIGLLFFATCIRTILKHLPHSRTKAFKLQQDFAFQLLQKFSKL